MRGKILYVGRDPDLPAFLLAFGTGGFSVSSVLPEKYRGEAADLLLWDVDAAPQSPAIPSGTRVTTVGYREGADLLRPFRFDEFEKLLDPSQASGGTVLSSVGRILYCRGGEVRLSSLEYDLTRVLLDAEGETVPTDRLTTVGGRALSARSLAVAVSALRQKLSRLPVPPRILSARGVGYRLLPDGN